MRRARRIAAVLVLVVIGWLALTPTGRYLARAAWAEGGILVRRRSIEAIVADKSTSIEAAAKLRLVLAARAFAADSIQLRTKKSFTTYTQLDRDTLVLVLSGAYPDRLVSYTWWFPIVGRVPYKGYFDFALARSAERDLAAKGFDVYLRPSPAFSTLGWFNDPLLSTSLHADTIDLANTVVHELTHNTFYAPGQAVLTNRSRASWARTDRRGSIAHAESRRRRTRKMPAGRTIRSSRAFGPSFIEASTQRFARIRPIRWRASRLAIHCTRKLGESW